MHATIIAGARVIPVREIDTCLKVFGNAELKFIAKDDVGEAIAKSRGSPVLAFD